MPDSSFSQSARGTPGEPVVGPSCSRFAVLSAVLVRPAEELHVLLDAVVCVVKMYTHCQIMHTDFRHHSEKYELKLNHAKDNVSIEHLVDEVMEEELTSLKSQYNSSPGSESSSDKDSLTDSLDHLNNEKSKTPPMLVHSRDIGEVDNQTVY